MMRGRGRRFGVGIAIAGVALLALAGVSYALITSPTGTPFVVPSDGAGNPVAFTDRALDTCACDARDSSSYVSTPVGAASVAGWGREVVWGGVDACGARWTRRVVGPARRAWAFDPQPKSAVTRATAPQRKVALNIGRIILYLMRSRR